MASADSPRVTVVRLARDKTVRLVRPGPPAAASKHGRITGLEKQVRLKPPHRPQPAVMPKRNNARMAARKAAVDAVAVVAAAAVQDKTAIQAIKEMPRPVRLKAGMPAPPAVHRMHLAIHGKMKESATAGLLHRVIARSQVTPRDNGPS